LVYWLCLLWPGRGRDESGPGAKEWDLLSGWYKAEDQGGVDLHMAEWWWGEDVILLWGRTGNAT